MSCTAQRIVWEDSDTRIKYSLLQQIVKLEGKQIATDQTIKIKWMWNHLSNWVKEW